MEDARTCLGCNGSGRNVRNAFTFVDNETGESKDYEKKVSICQGCNGRGTFLPPNVSEIEAEIHARRGLRLGRPKSPRGYYVWRMTRFHGGADVTMPIMAAIGIRHDPFKVELDALVAIMTKRYFKTDLAATERWENVLGYRHRDIPPPLGSGHRDEGDLR